LISSVFLGKWQDNACFDVEGSDYLPVILAEVVVFRDVMPCSLITIGVLQKPGFSNSGAFVSSAVKTEGHIPQNLVHMNETTQCHVLEESELHSYRQENLSCHI
jgi:hypothetical protein